jgi:hypothetical protein
MRKCPFVSVSDKEFFFLRVWRGKYLNDLYFISIFIIKREDTIFQTVNFSSRDERLVSTKPFSLRT